MTAAALLARTRSLHDHVKLLADQAGELRRDIRAAIWKDGVRDPNVDNAACDMLGVPHDLRQVVAALEKAMINLDCADVLAQMPDAEEAAVDAEIERRARVRG